jgi:hypothetical protein
LGSGAARVRAVRRPGRQVAAGAVKEDPKFRLSGSLPARQRVGWGGPGCSGAKRTAIVQLAPGTYLARAGVAGDEEVVACDAAGAHVLHARCAVAGAESRKRLRRAHGTRGCLAEVNLGASTSTKAAAGLSSTDTVAEGTLATARSGSSSAVEIPAATDTGATPTANVVGAPEQVGPRNRRDGQQTNARRSARRKQVSAT